MNARAEAERIRRQARALDVIGWVFILAGVPLALLGLIRDGHPDSFGAIMLVASLTLRAHTEVFRTRAVLVEVIERVGADR